MNRPTTHYRLLPGAPRIHTVPLPELSVGEGRVTLTLDDADENRLTFVFTPYQAVRVTTLDAFSTLPESGLRPGGVFVVEASEWIDELRSVLAQKDSVATFLDNAHHYVVPAGVDIVEVVAWGMTWSGAAGGAHGAPTEGQ